MTTRSERHTCADEPPFACAACLADECSDASCCMCGALDCPHGDETHYWHDGCSSCGGRALPPTGPHVAS